MILNRLKDIRTK